MKRPFDGIKIIDITHVLAGPFATYQLALLGADVIKVEDPLNPDQARESGTDKRLNDAKMGTHFLTQGSNKRAIALNLKSESGRDVLRKLVATADVMVENYRPGALAALGLGYEAMALLNPRLIYASFSAFGQKGPKSTYTAYDNVIQSTAGLMDITGTPQTSPLKVGAPVIDYATGTMGAFALASALFQREKTGRGQHIDMAMMDVALILMASHVTGYITGKKHPVASGNLARQATNMIHDTLDGKIMLGASNQRQRERLWKFLGRPDMIHTDKDETINARRDREAAVLREILQTKSAADWELLLQKHHIPASRVRSMAEALSDPQLDSRNILHRHDAMPGLGADIAVPVAAFSFDYGGPVVTTPPPQLGQDSIAVLSELGYSDNEITELKRKGDIA